MGIVDIAASLMALSRSRLLKLATAENLLELASRDKAMTLRYFVISRAKRNDERYVMVTT